MKAVLKALIRVCQNISSPALSQTVSAVIVLLELLSKTFIVTALSKKKDKRKLLNYIIAA